MQANPYLNRQIVLTSKHEKLKLVKPAFEQNLGCELIEVSLDTDQLGTFSGEVERKQPPLETAILKARLGMDHTGIQIGLASEGSVGPDPQIPFFNSNIENLVLVDDLNGIIISETYRSFDIKASTITAAPDQDLTTFLAQVDFPTHGLIVRPNTKEISLCIKGIIDSQQLVAAIKQCAAQSPNGHVVVESDLRAHFSPSRQKNIATLAQLLAKRVAQVCPKCKTPGWGRIDYKKGVICSSCGLIDENAIAQERLGCSKCNHIELGEILNTELNPAQCNFCNP